MQLKATCPDCSWSVEGWEVTSQNEKTLQTKADRHQEMRSEWEEENLTPEEQGEHDVKVVQE